MNNNTTIEFNGRKYSVDLDRANELGLLKPATRPVCISDIPNGALFMWDSKNKSCGIIKCVMINNKSKSKGQCVVYDSQRKNTGNNSWGHPGSLEHFSLRHGDSLSYYCPVLDTWIDEVPNGD